MYFRDFYILNHLLTALRLLPYLHNALIFYSYIKANLNISLKVFASTMFLTDLYR